jgi:hypothetical protein
LKGIATYRPNAILGAVLEANNTAVMVPQDLDLANLDRRIRLDQAPQPALASLRWPGRPECPNGNPCWTYSVRHPLGNFAVFFEIATATYLDGSTRRVRLLPFVLFGFLVNLFTVTRVTIWQALWRPRDTDVFWHKTEHTNNHNGNGRVTWT